MGYDGTEGTVATAASNVWNTITSALDNGYLVGVGTDDVTDFDLVPSHSWSLVDHHTISDGGNTYNLFRIRNPWGVDSDYSADWNDGDTTHWTANAKT